MAIGVSLLFSTASWYISSSSLGYTYDHIFNGYESIPTLVCTVAAFIIASKLEEALSKRRRLSQILNLVGRHTLTIYYSHWFIGCLLINIGIPLPSSILGNLIKAFLFVFSGTVAGMLLKRVPLIRRLIH